MAADGSRDELAYLEKAAAGTNASGTFKKMRRVSDTLDVQVSSTFSNEIADTRERADALRNGFQVGGTINAEVPPGAHDDLIASVLQADGIGSLGSLTLPAETTLSTGSGATFDDATETLDMISGGVGNITAGDWVLIAGGTGASSTSNNGWKKVTAVDDGNSTLTFASGSIIAAGTEPSTVTVSGGTAITNGETLRVYDIEKLRPDARSDASDMYEAYRDCYWNSFGLSGSPQSIMTSAFGVIALSHSLPVAAIGTTPYTVAGGTNRVANTINDATIYLAGSSINAGATTFSINATNNLAGRPAWGVEGFSSVRNGTFEASGSIGVYLDSDVERQRLLDDNSTDLALIIDADDGKLVLSWPAIAYSSTNRGSPGNNQDVVETLNFNAIKGSTTYPYTMKVQFFA